MSKSSELELQRAVSLHEVGRLLDVSKRTVYRLIAEGALPQPFKVGRSSRLQLSQVHAYIIRQQQEGR